MVHRFALPLLAGLAVSCGGETPPPQPPPPAEPAPAPAAAAEAPVPQEVLLRGTIRVGTIVTFRSCEGSALMTAFDSTGDLIRPSFRVMKASPEEGMYVVARGLPTTDGAEVVLRQLVLANRPGDAEGCNDPFDYRVKARGTAPDWTLAIKDQGIEFAQPDSANALNLQFPASEPDDSGGLVRYQASQDGHSLHLLLTRTSCSRGNSGAYMAMRADVVIDGRPLEGCAWSGLLP